MNSKGIKAIKNTDHLCWKCLKEKDNVHIIQIGSLGYGSYFDNMETKIQLCDECLNNAQKNNPIWELQVLHGNMSYEADKKTHSPGIEMIDENIDCIYKYEDEIIEYVHNLPLESQELFYNTYSYGACADYNMKPQDWIDFKLDELPHNKCKKYGFYSPEERNAYHERFPNCAEVYIKKYEDGSQGSWCSCGAHGDKDGNCGANISDKCYMCTHYKPKTEEAKVVDEVSEYYRHEKDRLIHMLQYASTRLRELENSVEDYMDMHRK